MENLEKTKKSCYTLKLRKGRHSKEMFTVHLNDVDETTFVMVSKLVKSDKEIEATKLLLKELYAGGDNIDEVLSCFPAVHSAMGAVLELVQPLEYELKKN